MTKISTEYIGAKTFYQSPYAIAFRTCYVDMCDSCSILLRSRSSWFGIPL